RLRSGAVEARWSRRGPGARRPDPHSSHEGGAVSEVVNVGGHRVGTGEPIYLIAEIGINHNGELAIAKQLVDAAMLAGCDAVKFQKRTPELAVPPEQRDLLRETPWGLMTYLEYRH